MLEMLFHRSEQHWLVTEYNNGVMKHALTIHINTVSTATYYLIQIYFIKKKVHMREREGQLKSHCKFSMVRWSWIKPNTALIALPPICVIYLKSLDESISYLSLLKKWKYFRYTTGSYRGFTTNL